ncbi:RCC1 domain-containing protein [Candidatus Riflebacteria bacterium]
MKRTTLLSFLISFMIVFYLGCGGGGGGSSTNPAAVSTTEDSSTTDTSSSTPTTSTTEEVSGEIELPAGSGSGKIIPREVFGNFQYSGETFQLYVNSTEVTLTSVAGNPRKATFKGDVEKAEQYQLQLKNSKGASVLKGYVPRAIKNQIRMDYESTANALLYEQKKLESNADFSFENFEKQLDNTILDAVKKEVKEQLSKSSILTGDISINNLTVIVNIVNITVINVTVPIIYTPSSGGSSGGTSTTPQSTTTTTAGPLPAGSLAINDGAATTDSVNVILNLTVTRATGVTTMSVDGDDFESLNMAKSHTLSSGDGTKTVTIILKDDNGLSKSITDTIKLETTPSSSSFNGKVAAGEGHALWVKSDKTIWARGNNSNGQVGDRTTTTRADWVQVGVQGEISTSIRAATGALTDVVDISAGGSHSLAVKSDGTVWGWGNNQYGQTGNGNTTTPQSSPVQISGLSGLVAISAGDNHTLALKSDGTVWGWGNNQYGQTGNGNTTSPQSSPVQTSNLSSVIAISAGGNHSLALKSDGTVWSWGNGQYGQLGWLYCGSAPSNSKIPTQVTGLSDIKAIAAGGYHCIALKSDGTVWAWGQGSNGQLGHGASSLSQQNTPVQVSGLSSVTSIAAGAYHTLAQKSDGTVWGWGNNSSNQLGGSAGSYNVPIQMSITNVVAMGGGYNTTIFQQSDDTTKLYGSY